MTNQHTARMKIVDNLKYSNSQGAHRYFVARLKTSVVAAKRAGTRSRGRVSATAPKSMNLRPTNYR
jgi:hypothetical protein